MCHESHCAHGVCINPTGVHVSLCIDRGRGVAAIVHPGISSGMLAQVLNQTHNDQLRALLSKPGQPVSDAAFISIDRLGADVRVRFGTEYSVERIGFDQVCSCLNWALAQFDLGPICPCLQSFVMQGVRDRAWAVSRAKSALVSADPTLMLCCCRVVQPVHTVEEATANMARLLPVTEDPVKKIT